MAADSYTTRALIQGALHVEANFTLKAQSGTLRLVNGKPDFDLRSILTTSNNGTRKIGQPPNFEVNKLKHDDSAFIKAKLETISTFRRGILSKVEEGADVYKADVSVFDTAKIECKLNDGVCYDCTIPCVSLLLVVSSPAITFVSHQNGYRFMIVSTYPAIDVAVGHAREAEEDTDSEGKATVTFQNVSIPSNLTI